MICSPLCVRTYTERSLVANFKWVARRNNPEVNLVCDINEATDDR